MTFNERDVTTEIGGTWLELGGGLDVQVTDKLSAYSKASYAFSFDGDLDDAVKGDIGMRVTW